MLQKWFHVYKQHTVAFSLPFIYAGITMASGKQEIFYFMLCFRSIVKSLVNDLSTECSCCNTTLQNNTLHFKIQFGLD